MIHTVDLAHSPSAIHSTSFLAFLAIFNASDEKIDN